MPATNVLTAAVFGAALALTASMAGCGTDSEAKLILSEAAACETIGNGLTAIAPLVAAGKLDARGRAVLDSARATARPFCSDPKNPPKSLAAALPKLVQAAGQIEGLAAAIGGK